MTGASQALNDLNLDNPVEEVNPNSEKVIKNLVLASIHCWLQKGTREVVHASAKKGFIESDIKDAAVLLTDVGHKYQDRRGGAKRGYTDLFMDDILTHLSGRQGPHAHHHHGQCQLGQDAAQPQGPMSNGDSVEVTTRLGNLEKQLSDLSVAITQIASGGVADPPMITVGREATFAGVVSGPGAGPSVGGDPNNGGGRGRPIIAKGRFNLLGQSAQDDTRSRSASQKRKLSDGTAQEGDEFQKQKKRDFKADNNKEEKEKEKKGKKPNTTERPNLVGTGGNVSSAGKTAPFIMYVGRTHPDTSDKVICDLVADYTKSDEKPDGVIVSNVDMIFEMKDQKERIVSKCWCISFQFEDKDLMMEASSWPAGWS